MGGGGRDVGRPSPLSSVSHQELPRPRCLCPSWPLPDAGLLPPSPRNPPQPPGTQLCPPECAALSPPRPAAHPETAARGCCHLPGHVVWSTGSFLNLLGEMRLSWVTTKAPPAPRAPCRHEGVVAAGADHAPALSLRVPAASCGDSAQPHPSPGGRASLCIHLPNLVIMRRARGSWQALGLTASQSSAERQ